MLRVRREIRQMQAPNSQQNPAGWLIECRHRTGNVRNLHPAVTGLFFPVWARQSDKRNVRFGAGHNGVRAHLHRKGMRGVDHMCDAAILKVGLKSFNTAKTTNTLRQRLPSGPVHTARETHGAAQTSFGRRIGEGRGFGCAPEDQEVRQHV